jgi:DNA uptake protein ComE-like DNA-binding protein
MIVKTHKTNMKKILRQTLTLLLFLSASALYAQNEINDEHLENLIESIIEETEEEYDITMIMEDLQEYADQPLNINTATRQQLSRLYLLDPLQIQKLLDYLEKYGPAYSIYELNAIEGIDEKVLSDLQPFICFGALANNPARPKNILSYGRHELLLRTLGTVQKPKGYLAKEDGSVPFEGNRLRYYARYKFKSGDDLSAGITAEKDPGESFFCGSNRTGFDFYSAHAGIKISKVVENIILGDFVVRAGQGLVLWQGFSAGKSSGTLNISKMNQDVRPYTSANENQFFRGVASTLNFNNKKISLFFSRKNRDGNLVFPDTSAAYFTSLQTSGYHRTKNEIADKKSVNDMNTGAVGQWYFGSFKIGAAFLYRKFDKPFIPADQLYNYFRFRGRTNIVGGINYLLSKGKYQLFGEAAMSGSKSKAYLQGAIANIHDQLNLSFLFRHFDKDYNALWASVLSEGSSARDETGFYAGIEILPVKYVSISAYSDMFCSEWISYSTITPLKGREFQIQADFKISDQLNFYLKFRNKKKDKKIIEAERYITTREHYKKTRLHMQYCPCDNLILKTRMENVLYNQQEKEYGWLVFQDIQCSTGRIPLNFSVRIAWFDSESYNSRIYAYENDLLYSFSIPAYFDKGFRTYLNMKYKISDKTELWFKLANTTIKNAESTGTGYNEIHGNKKTEVKFQIRLKM